MIRLLKNTIAILLTVILLSGCLETIFVGTASTAAEFAKDRSAGDTINDVKIAARIKAELIKSGFRNIYSRIKVEVVKSRVLLTGVVEKEEHALTAVQVSWNQAGVVDVLNELKVDKNSGKFDLIQYTRDTMITSQVKSKIFMDRSIKFINYTVITIDDVVYLFGIARSEESLEKVANIAAKVKSVKRVISHVKVDRSSTRKKPDNTNNKVIDSDLIDDADSFEEMIIDNASSSSKQSEDIVSGEASLDKNSSDW